MSRVRTFIESTRNISNSSPIFSGTTTANNLIVIGDYTTYGIDDILEYDFKKSDPRSPLFTKVSPSAFTIATNFITSVNGVLVGTDDITTVTLSLAANLDTGTKTAGTDYYVYALDNGNFVISANASYPSGYTTTNSRKIGGFHYGLIPETFGAVNNITSADATAIAGINQYSFWDLKWKPKSSPEGMVKIGGSWYDIYLLNSEHIVNGTSKAGATIAGGATDYGRAIPKIPLIYGGNGSTTYGSFTWFEAAETAKAYNKRLISYKEFGTIAYGVLEETSSNDSDATIKHIANYTSKFGLCQVTGHQWIWGADLNNGYGTEDFAWRSGLTETRGQIYATTNAPTAVRLGGYWVEGSSSGSRCSVWDDSVWDSGWSIGCRFASDHLVLV